jgi:uncharacterized membrane protein SpoIIM required for sporulation
MNRESFIRNRRDDWSQLESLLARLQSIRPSNWTSADISGLARLYRGVCYDLSLVQSREWGARLEQYLNDLVAQGHSCLYRSPPQSLSAVWSFFAVGFPQLFRRRWKPFVLALGLFVIPFVAALWAGYARPDLAALVMDSKQLDDAIRMYSRELYADIDNAYVEQRSGMAGFYVMNNTGIAFQAYALGILCGVGTCYILLSNGIGIGMVMGAILAAGPPASGHFTSFVISHGSFELTAIVISGAAGLVLAQGLLMPGQRTRIDSLKFHGRESLQLALGAGGMLFIAALLEGYFSPLPIAATIKYTVGSGLWLLVASYLAFAGRERTTA